MNQSGKRFYLGVYDRACLLSLAGVVAATGAMILASMRIIDLALALLVVAGVADLFDGVLARRVRRGDFQRAFGVQLDTTVDVVAFVAAPTLIAVNAAPIKLPLAVAAVCYVVAGVVRLAHFNALEHEGVDQSTHHRGLAVTYSALVLPLLFLWRDEMTPAVFGLLLAATLLLMALLFVMNLPIRKPRGIFYVLLSVLAAGLAGYWTWHFLDSFA